MEDIYIYKDLQGRLAMATHGVRCGRGQKGRLMPDTQGSSSKSKAWGSLWSPVQVHMKRPKDLNGKLKNPWWNPAGHVQLNGEDQSSREEP